MRISFDLDDTLICYDKRVPREATRVPFLLRRWFSEPLRMGAVALLKELDRQGHEIWVYTTSYRSEGYVKWFLWFYGVRVERVINQADHDREWRQRPKPSKAPHRFGIDLHIDDSTLVGEEAGKHGFSALILEPLDEEWVGKVLERVGRGRGS